jgi:ankyrin repeat protein
MFETLEDKFEKSQPPLDRRWPIVLFTAGAVVGLVYLMEGVRRHDPLGAVVGAVVSLLFLIWLMTTVRSPVPVSRRDFWVRSRIVVWILFAYQAAYTVAGFPRTDPTEILRAADNGDLEKTRLLLKHNPNLVFVKSKEGFTALHYAASHGYVEIAKLLLAERADVNAKASKGDAPLHYAVRNGHKETMQLLLSNNADVDIQDGIGRTPLYDAAANGQMEEVELLLAAKADVNAKTLRGYTALTVAASDGREDVARLLIDAGANVNDADVNGHTALYWAQTRKHERIADLIRLHGGLELPCANPESPSR